MVLRRRIALRGRNSFPGAGARALKIPRSHYSQVPIAMIMSDASSRVYDSVAGRQSNAKVITLRPANLCLFAPMSYISSSGARVRSRMCIENSPLINYNSPASASNSRFIGLMRSVYRESSACVGCIDCT